MINNDFIKDWLRKNFGGKDLKIGDVLKLQIQRQPAYKEYCQSHAPNPFVGHLSVDSDEATIVAYLRQVLKAGRSGDFNSSNAWYDRLVERTIALGIFFHKPQSGENLLPARAEDFPGFAVADSYLPLMSIHPAVAPEEGIFRLIHQLCQICLGLSGIYGFDDSEPDEETLLCQAVTDEFLVPESEFSQLWQTDLEKWQSNLWPLERHFKIDQRVLARRALKLGYISEKEHSDFIATYHHGLLENEAWPRSGMH